MQARMQIFEFPPKDSCKSLVNLPSRYGICDLSFPKFCLLLSLARAAMQFPSAAIDLLMFFASSNFLPFENVFESLSEPARSTIVSNPFFRCFFFIFFGEEKCGGWGWLVSSIHLYSIRICKTAWLLLDSGFILVAFVILPFIPLPINLKTSSRL